MVNVAFRLVSATKEMACDLVLGQGTHEFIAGFLEGSYFQERVAKLKGYEEPVIGFAGDFSSLPGVLETVLRKMTPL